MLYLLTWNAVIVNCVNCSTTRPQDESSNKKNKSTCMRKLQVIHRKVKFQCQRPINQLILSFILLTIFCYRRYASIIFCIHCHVVHSFYDRFKRHQVYREGIRIDFGRCDGASIAERIFGFFANTFVRHVK